MITTTISFNLREGLEDQILDCIVSYKITIYKSGRIRLICASEDGNNYEFYIPKQGALEIRTYEDEEV